MHRFFVTDIHDNQIVFSPEQARQIDAVLRMEPGRRVMALDNAGWEYEVELVEVKRKRVTAVILAQRPAPNEPTNPITLYQSLLKRDNFEWVLQKGTEIGVARFVPLITERTVARPPKKPDRWRRILTEAAEQSRRGRIPELAEPTPLAQALADLPPHQTALISWENVAKTSLRDELVGASSLNVSLFIGPEGGFTAVEIEQAQKAGAIPITLGQRILRAETAAIVATAIVLHELGDMT
ncbi:MAG: 16S rRNA (uracil(1498)-N(3))-methyltransferase [Chloroflexi bacterium]|nr:16S rRNA (uracil(1498)-N(3))-methyltransferase [Chloroflexota bacterium]